MKIIKIVSEKLGQNNYLVTSEESAILIDGSAFVSQVEENLKYTNVAKLGGIFLTHCHFDHIIELDNLIAKYKCPVYICINGKNSLYNENENMSILDKPFKVKTKRGIKTFKDGEEIVIGDITVKCFNTPGHTIDSSCFKIEDNLFTGDTLFKVGVGRFDLFGGDEMQLKISLERIKNRLSQGIITFYPGHGSNFDKDEMAYNIEHYLGE